MPGSGILVVPSTNYIPNQPSPTISTDTTPSNHRNILTQPHQTTIISYLGYLCSLLVSDALALLFLKSQSTGRVILLKAHQNMACLPSKSSDEFHGTQGSHHYGQWLKALCNLAPSPTSVSLGDSALTTWGPSPRILSASGL